MSHFILREKTNMVIYQEFFQAVDTGDHEKVSNLVKNKFFNINVKTIQGDTPLTLAASKSFYKVIQILVLQQRLDINHKGSGGATALKHAAFNGDIATLKALAKHPNFDPNITDNQGVLPLINSITFEHTEFSLELMKIPGIKVNFQEKTESSILQSLFESQIILNNKRKLFTRLLELDIDIVSQGFPKETIPEELQQCIDIVAKKKKAELQKFIPMLDLVNLVLKF